jgi:hypothetical protein
MFNFLSYFSEYSISYQEEAPDVLRNVSLTI